MSASELRCPVCCRPLDLDVMVVQFRGLPDLEAFTRAWTGLGEPESLELSETLYAHTATFVWPQLSTLELDDPILRLARVPARAVVGDAGIWMRPTTVAYVNLPCVDCQHPVGSPVPEEAFPIGVTVRCVNCEAHLQRRLRKLLLTNQVENES